MSALENVAIGAHLRGHAGVLRSAWRLDRAEEARLLAEAARQLDRVGLGAHCWDKAGSLALGQQRILEIARALAADPCLLLLDEPAAGLRYQEKRVLAGLLERLRTEGVSILLIEQNARAALQVADYAYVLEMGRVTVQGPAAEIARDPRVIEVYLGLGQAATTGRGAGPADTADSPAAT